MQACVGTLAIATGLTEAGREPCSREARIRTSCVPPAEPDPHAPKARSLDPRTLRARTDLTMQRANVFNSSPGENREFKKKAIEFPHPFRSLWMREVVVRAEETRFTRAHGKRSRARFFSLRL
jgi:hypothetical protein